MTSLSNQILLNADNTPYQILLADDDLDDCLFFKEAIEELNLSAQLTIVHHGEELMQLLNESENLPCVLFLDLNMPRKNGFECLKEIKRTDKLKALPVIILSTSLNEATATQLHHNGAHHYIRKPSEFAALKNLIDTAIKLTAKNKLVQPGKDQFVLSK